MFASKTISSKFQSCDVGIAPYDEVQKNIILQKCGKRKFLGATTVKPRKICKNIISHRKNFTSYKTVRFEHCFVRQFYGDMFLFSDILTSEN